MIKTKLTTNTLYKKTFEIGFVFEKLPQMFVAKLLKIFLNY